MASPLHLGSPKRVRPKSFRDDDSRTSTMNIKRLAKYMAKLIGLALWWLPLIDSNLLLAGGTPAFFFWWATPG
jgi:hypothetical protein